jgi:hypothetical protein
MCESTGHHHDIDRKVEGRKEGESENGIGRRKK